MASTDGARRRRTDERGISTECEPPATVAHDRYREVLQARRIRVDGDRVHPFARGPRP